MWRRSWLALSIVSGLMSASACIDLGGLAGPSPSAASEGGTEGGLVEGGADAPTGANDGGADSGPDGECQGTKGPTPVRVGSYCVDSTEVSGTQYTEFLAAKAGDTRGQPAECAWNTSYQPSTSASGNTPVFGVDWCDARAYCAWAGKRLCGKIGGGPTPSAGLNSQFSSEWYRACTKDGTRAFPYGNVRDPDACNGSDRDGGHGPTDVGSLKTCKGGYPGLFDMCGNLWEWEDSCEDGGANAQCAVRGSSFASPNAVSCDTLLTFQRDRGGANDVTVRCCSD
jgi:formylglycine-generating enzyme required for sulfatase activity